MSSDNKPSVWRVVVLYLLSLLFVTLGVGQCYEQLFGEGFWPVPIGVAFVLLGGYLWHLGSRARLRLSGDRRTA